MDNDNDKDDDNGEDENKDNDIDNDTSIRPTAQEHAGKVYAAGLQHMVKQTGGMRGRQQDVHQWSKRSKGN